MCKEYTGTNYPKEYVSDSYEKLFSAESDLMADLKQMEDNGHWEEFQTSDLGLSETEPMYLTETMHAVRVGIPEETVYDTAAGGSKLILATPLGAVPLRQQAVVQVFGTALALTNTKETADETDDVNLIAAVFEAAKTGKNRASRKNQIWICADKVTACGSKEYLVMRLDDVFNTAKTALEAKFGADLEFVEGYNSFNYSKAIYRLGGAAEATLRQKYEQMAHNSLHSLNGCLPTFEVVVQSSNAKSSAAMISGTMKSSTGARIPVGNVVRVEHKRRTGGSQEGLDLLRDRAADIFAKFGDSATRLSEMGKVVLWHPLDAITHLCNKAGGISNKLIAAARNDLSRFLAGSSCSMFDAYLSICEIQTYAKNEGYSRTQLDQLEEAISRILYYRWSEEDYEDK